MANDRLNYGTVETPKLAANSAKLEKVRKKQSKLQHKLKYDMVSGKGLLGSEKKEVRKKGLLGEKGRTHLFFKETGRRKLNEQEYEKWKNKLDRKKFRQEVFRDSMYKKTKAAFDDENLEDDELMSDMKRGTRKKYIETTLAVRGNVRNLRKLNNQYARIRYMKEKESILSYKREKIFSKARKAEYKSKIKSASSSIQKRQLKKEMASAIKAAEGNWFRRTTHQFIVKKKAADRRRRVVKRVASTVLSISSLFVIFLALFGIGFIILLGAMQGAAEYNAKAVTQNDYSVISESSAYLKQLETDLEEYLYDKAVLEDEIKTTYDPDIYEFVYDLAELGFSSNTLMAYLSAKYGSFTLEQVKTDLDEIFEGMYELKIEIKEEMREIEDTSVIDPATGKHPVVEELKKICHVTLVKVELEEVVEGRLSETEKELYNNYKLTVGGQQVYGPVMLEDWTNLISSDYGERIHPITGVRTFHNGIDIAIPEGTKLYSAVSGTVILAQYSETAGNYMKVQTDSGWVVTFMHMDSLSVTKGQKVDKGDFVGLSGNTGRSTGPHLHLEVRDSQNNTINPLFIVPQNCYKASEKEE